MPHLERRIERLRLSVYLGPTTDTLAVWLTKHYVQQPAHKMPQSDRLSLSYQDSPYDAYMVLARSTGAILAAAGLDPSQAL